MNMSHYLSVGFDINRFSTGCSVEFDEIEHNMLLRFGKKIFCHIRTRYVYRKYIFLYENKSCSLFF